MISQTKLVTERCCDWLTDNGDDLLGYASALLIVALYTAYYFGEI